MDIYKWKLEDLKSNLKEKKLENTEKLLPITWKPRLESKGCLTRESHLNSWMLETHNAFLETNSTYE